MYYYTRMIEKIQRYSQEKEIAAKVIYQIQFIIKVYYYSNRNLEYIVEQSYYHFELKINNSIQERTYFESSPVFSFENKS